MEVLGDVQFRTAIAGVGGMDELVREFIRIPPGAGPAAVRGILQSPGRLSQRRLRPRAFSAREQALHGVPLAAQLMGAECAPCAQAAAALASPPYGARRVDLNCGCPSRSAHNGGGAGASLMREPDRLHAVAREMVVSVRAEVGSAAVVSVKMRSGFEDDTLFDENVCAARDAGVAAITVHGRTRKQGYAGRADWSKVARAVELCRGYDVMVIGNGDCVSGQDVCRMAVETGCDGVMVGRGAVMDPWIFWDAQAEFSRLRVPAGGARAPKQHNGRGLADWNRGLCMGGKPPRWSGRSFEEEKQFWKRFLEFRGGPTTPKEHKQSISRLKMVLQYYKNMPEEQKQRLLSQTPHIVDARDFLNELIYVIRVHNGGDNDTKSSCEVPLDREKVAPY